MVIAEIIACVLLGIIFIPLICLFTFMFYKDIRRIQEERDDEMRELTERYYRQFKTPIENVNPPKQKRLKI